MKKKIALLLLFVTPLFISCFEDRDDVIQVADSSTINDFIYRGLNFFYLYKTDTPELADDFFPTEADYNAFLNSYDTPESFFQFLKAPQDRFSILVSDYIALENALSGVSLNNGMEYGLVLYPDGSNNVFGYIRYILPNSDAQSKGLMRGQIFNTVDGQQIVAQDDGNGNLFVDTSIFSPTSFTIGLATYDGTSVTPTGESVSLTKEEYTEDPIFVTNIIDTGTEKVGYLMYNAFTRQFDSQLNAVFGDFKAQGVTDLVLDLRYNGGGSVRTATYLASMITGQNTGQVFYSEEWNPDRQQEYASDGLFVDSFVNGGEAINSLNLNQVYVLTSGRTASASELVINGLTPYIDVVQIGEFTTGKYQASFLLYDAPAPNFARSQANPDHTYAMLPLVFKTANANGNTDYDDGLPPDIALEEDYANLGILGDENEPLLAAALADITGIPIPDFNQNSFTKALEISERKAASPIYQLMIKEND